MSEEDSLTTQDYLQKRVLIHGLQAKPELNGKHGRVIKHVAEKDRFQVDIDGGGQLLLKMANLKLAEEEGEASEPLEFLAQCDVTGVPLNYNDWWHRDGDSQDLCDAEYSKLPKHEQVRFVPIRSLADVHRVFGPPPADNDGPTASWADENFSAPPNEKMAAAIERAAEAVDSLLGAGARHLNVTAIVSHAKMLDPSAEALPVEAAQAAMVRKAKSSDGFAYHRHGGDDCTLAVVRSDS